jgi:hypothetical protein
MLPAYASGIELSRGALFLSTADVAQSSIDAIEAGLKMFSNGTVRRMLKLKGPI